MEIWTILVYVFGVLFNIGAVSVIRTRAMEKGKAFLSSGKGAFVLVFALCFLHQLVVGGFGALQDAQSFVALLQSASTMTAAAMGTHTVFTARSK